MNISTRMALLIVLCFMLLSFHTLARAQDGNNYSDRYRENYNQDRYSNEYRENYRDNIRYRSDIDRQKPPSSKAVIQAESSSPSFYSSVMKSPRRTINLPTASQGSKGGGTSSSGISGLNPLLLSPPSLLRFYLSGKFPITNLPDDTELPAIEIETEPVQETAVLSPSELLFEEGVELFRQRRYQAAAKNFRHLLDINAEDASKAAAYSLCCLAMRDYDSASEWMNKADSGMNDVEDLYVLIQNIYANKQDFLVHFKQLETKINNNEEDEKLNYLASILQSVNERY